MFRRLAWSFYHWMYPNSRWAQFQVPAPEPERAKEIDSNAAVPTMTGGSQASVMFGGETRETVVTGSR